MGGIVFIVKVQKWFCFIVCHMFYVACIYLVKLLQDVFVICSD